MENRELNFDYTIGDKVYCVNDKHTYPACAWEFQEWPIKDKPYTVRGFAENDGIVTGVYMEELHNKPIPMKFLNNRIQEPAFATWRFKKAEEVTGHAEDELLNELLAPVSKEGVINFDLYEVGKLNAKNEKIRVNIRQ